MKKLTCTLLLSLATWQVAAAQDSTAGAAPASDTSADAFSSSAGKPNPAIELKNKSSFVLEPSSRNPFWPIGWKPATKVTTNTTERQAGPDISANAFVVSSIILGQGSSFAIINGKPMHEGQVFGLQMGNEIYQITVKSIEDGQVILQRRDQEIAVPLRRR